MILNLLDTRNLLDPWREGDSCAYRGKLAPGHIFPSTLPKPTTGALRILRWAAWATDDPDLVQQPSGFCWLRHLLKYCCKPHIVTNSRAMEASRLFESHNLWEQPVWCRSSAHLLQYWNLKQPQPLYCIFLLGLCLPCLALFPSDVGCCFFCTPSICEEVSPHKSCWIVWTVWQLFLHTWCWRGIFNIPPKCTALLVILPHPKDMSNFLIDSIAMRRSKLRTHSVPWMPNSLPNYHLNPFNV